MHKDIDKLPEDGIGIKIMSYLADKLNYPRTPKPKNRLPVVKNYEQQGFDLSQPLQKTSVLEQLIKFFKGLLNWLKSKLHWQQMPDTPLEKIDLQVQTNLNELNQVLQWFAQLEHLPICKTVLWQCQLALAEGFTNAVRHAHKDLPSDTPIDLEVTVFNESLEIRIWDYGQPFNLEAKLSEFREIDQLAGGGRGLILMVQLAAQVRYIRSSDQQNCLIIVSNYH